MRLRYQLILMTVVPLLLAGTLFAFEVIRLTGGIREAAATQEMVAHGRAASAAIHEIQKERGYSAGFTGSKGKVFADEVAAQRRATNDAVAALAGALDAFAGRNEALAAEIRVQLTAMAEMRGRIDALEATVPELAGFYTGAIRNLIRMAGDGYATVASVETQRLSVGYLALMEAKEAAGLERAMGAVGFGSGAFAEAVHTRFQTLRGRQAAELDAAATAVPPALAADVEEALDGAARARIVELRAVADASIRGGDMTGVTGPEWFAASTA